MYPYFRKPLLKIHILLFLQWGRPDRQVAPLFIRDPEVCWVDHGWILVVETNLPEVGGSISGVPLYRWMVYFMENPSDLDDGLGYRNISGNLQILSLDS